MELLKGTRAAFQNSPHPPKPSYQLNICTGKVCKRQGSVAILKFAQDLGVQGIEVDSCGCLGDCGKGPNSIIYPSAMHVNKVSQPSVLSEVLEVFCDIHVPDALIRATELRMAGNELARDGELQQAIKTYTEGIEVLESGNCSAGLYMLYSNRSAAKLSLGQKEDALVDALAAVDAAPPGWHTAWIRVIDAYYSLGRFSEAAAAVQQAVQADATFRQLVEYKAITQALQRQGVKVT